MLLCTGNLDALYKRIILEIGDMFKGFLKCMLFYFAVTMAEI